jgi:hypothetical protein
MADKKKSGESQQPEPTSRINTREPSPSSPTRSTQIWKILMVARKVLLFVMTLTMLDILRHLTNLPEEETVLVRVWT